MIILQSFYLFVNNILFSCQYFVVFVGFDNKNVIVV